MRRLHLFLTLLGVAMMGIGAVRAKSVPRQRSVARVVRRVEPRPPALVARKARHPRLVRRVCRLTVTGYCLGPCRECETIGLTCRGTRCPHGAAVSRRGWLRALPIGAKVHVPGYGWARVDDVGGRVHAGQIDLRFSTHRYAQRWGKRKLEVVALLPSRA